MKSQTKRKPKIKKLKCRTVLSFGDTSTITHDIQIESNYEDVNMPAWIITALQKCLCVPACLCTDTVRQWSHEQMQTHKDSL